MLSNNSKPKTLVLDASALINGVLQSGIDLKMCTTPAVIDEARGRGYSSFLRGEAQRARDLAVMEASPEILELVKVRIRELGESARLSNTDISVIALAMHLKNEGTTDVIIMTDDYSLQNVAAAMGIQAKSSSTQGITKQIEWTYYCPACFKKYDRPSKDMSCRFCGTKLKRKPTVIGRR
jgi:UPF0271 protein